MSQPSPAPNGTAALIAEWWSQLLGVDTVVPEDDFFDLGGTSLTLIRFVDLVQDHYGVELPMDELFADDFTPAAVATAIEDVRRASGSEATR